MDPDGDPLGIYLRSLDNLKDRLPEDVLALPGHNLPFFGLYARLGELAAHHEARCAETIAACERPHSAADLLPVMFRRQLDRHQTAFALGEALAHLHYVANQGEIECMTGADGVARFLKKAA